MTPASAPTHVYVISSATGHIKIGISNNPRKRLASLQVASAFPLALEHVQESSEALRVERLAHGILGHSRANGEWFATSVASAIAAIQKASEAEVPDEPKSNSVGMTPADFRAAIATLNLSQVGAARFFGVGDRTSRRWISGEYEVPPAVTYCLSLMIRHNVNPGDLDKKFKK